MIISAVSKPVWSKKKFAAIDWKKTHATLNGFLMELECTLWCPITDAYILILVETAFNFVCIQRKGRAAIIYKFIDRWIVYHGYESGPFIWPFNL